MCRRTRGALTLGLITQLVACCGPAGLAQPPAAVARKPGAPVQIDATLHRVGAHVVVTLQAAATALSVQLRGADGLRLLQPSRSLHDRSGAAGDTFTLTVAFDDVSPQGTLVVCVEGDFGGSRQQRLGSFRIGGSPLQPRQLVAGSPPVQLLPAREQIH